jgi:Ca-activated chloride channel family protein
MFRFGHIESLWWLLLIPALIVVYILYVRAQRRRLARLGNVETLRGLMPEVSPKRVRRKFMLLLIAIGLIVTALARPQFGSKLKEVTRRGVEIIIAVDVSNSMLAEDFEPNRLERTKFAIDRLVEQLREDRIGIIVFAGDAYVQLPITSDYVAARNFARHLSPDMVSRQGTAMGAAIDLAALSFSAGSEGSSILILVSDGENHEDDPVAAAQAAAEKGITIYTIGIGTDQGAPIFIDGDYLTDEEGNMVVTRLDETTLEQVALATGGAYIRATNRSVGLDEIIRQVNEVEKKELTAQVFEDYNEQYQYILAIALFFLILEALILARKNRILARFNIFKTNGPES